MQWRYRANDALVTTVTTRSCSEEMYHADVGGSLHRGRALDLETIPPTRRQGRGRSLRTPADSRPGCWLRQGFALFISLRSQLLGETSPGAVRRTEGRCICYHRTR